MSGARAAWEVARWEFRRYFKWKQQLVGLVLTMVGGAAGWGLVQLGRGGAEEPVRVAVVGEALAPVAVPEGRVAYEAHPAAGEAALRAAVGEGTLDGLLLVRDRARAELVVAREAGWTAEVEASLAAARRAAEAGDAGLTPEGLAGLLAPVAVEVVYHEAGAPPRPKGETLAVVIAVVLMVMGIFTGMGYVFASITGEKQNRVTEQVVAAIPPQAWMDGKIAGLAAVSLVTVLGTALATGVILAVIAAARGGLSLPDTLGRPGVLAVTAAMALLGFLFWFAFMAVVAATIDDPNTSTRTPLLFLPSLAAGAALLALADADGALVRTLALLPPFSATMLPARMLLTEVPWWEPLAALVLLAGAVWVLRRAAGRVFHVAMLMYGKEPTWREVRRWARAGAG